MNRITPLFVSLGLALCASGCAAPQRAPAGDPATATGGRWRAEILRAEDRSFVDDALLASLASGDPERRRLAVRALGRIGGPRTVQPLRDAFEDDDAGVRAEAVFAAGISGATELIAPIVYLARDPSSDVRSAVAVSLGLFASREGHAAILELLGDESAAIRTAACYAAARLDGAEEVADRVVQHMRDEDPNVALAATYAVSRLAGRIQAVDFRKRVELRRTLIQLANSPNPTLRMLVAEGLNVPLAGEQADTLAAMYQLHDDPSGHMAILRSTSFPGAPAFVIHEKSLFSDDPRVVYATVVGLGRMKGNEINALLLDRIIRDDRRFIKIEAIRGLARADRATALTVANGLTNDEHPAIRAAAAELLYGQTGERAAEYAWRLFGDAQPEVRLAAIPALAATAEPLTSIFADLLDGAGHDGRLAMARAAGYRLADPDRDEADRRETWRLLSALWTRTGDGDQPAVRLALLAAAGEGASDERVRDFWRAALEARDRGVQKRAAVLLRERFGESHDPAPTTAPKPLSHYERILAWAATPRAAVVTFERPGFLPGRITVALDTANAPLTSWRFARAAESGYYDDRPLTLIVPGLRVHSGRGGGERTAVESWPAETVPHGFGGGTLATATQDGASLGEWLITLEGRPNYLGRYAPFGRVVQNLAGVAAQALPGDRVVSVRMYEGDGSEPLPPLAP